MTDLPITTTDIPITETDDFTLGLILPLVFFGTLLIIVTVCAFWHSRADTNITRTTTSENTTHPRSLIDNFSFARSANRGSIRSDAPLNEQAIPNDYIPPLHPQKNTKIIKRLPDLPGQVNLTLTDSEHFVPDLSTVTEESRELKPVPRGSGFVFDNTQAPIPAFHLATWLLYNRDPNLRNLDTREVRSDPNIVFGINSISESSEMSTFPPSKSEHSESSLTSSSMPKSIFHPNHNSPNTNSQTDSYTDRLESMRYTITREGAPDQMANRSDISTLHSSNNTDPIRHPAPEPGLRQSSYGSSTTKVESSNNTMILYDSGARAPPGSLKDSLSLSQPESLTYHQPHLEQMVQSYNELHHRYLVRHEAYLQSATSVQSSANNSMQPEVGSSNTTSKHEWDKSSLSGSDNLMLAGGPLPLRPPVTVSRERSFTDSERSIARERPRASDLLYRRRTLSQETPSSAGQSVDWDHSSPIFGPPLLNSTDLSQLRAQSQGHPILARKQYWV